MGGEEHLRDRRGLNEIEVGRNRHRHSLMRNHKLSLAPSSEDSKDSIANFVTACDARPQLVNFTGIFEPRNIRWSSCRRRILSTRLQQVGPIQPASPHANPDLIALRFRCWNITNIQDLRPADPGNDNRFHGR
jgi:hypothetical protein